ncbi:MAG: hypothetical protein RL098_472, partial [Bacteroidota bacterium]
DIGEAPFCFGPGVANPAGKSPFCLLQKEFSAIGPAVAIDKKVVRVVVDVIARERSLFEFNEVFHAFVINFDGRFVAVFVKITEVVETRYQSVKKRHSR